MGIIVAVASCGGSTSSKNADQPQVTVSEPAPPPPPPGYETAAPAIPATPAPAEVNPPPVDVGPTPVSVTGTTTKMVFQVTGYAPQGVTVMYGSDSDNRSDSDGLGVLGDGVALPWTGKLAYRDGQLYYFVSAQLEGGGDITVKVIQRNVTHYSDGHIKIHDQVMDSGHASGGYNIAEAQWNIF